MRRHLGRGSIELVRCLTKWIHVEEVHDGICKGKGRSETASQGNDDDGDDDLFQTGSLELLYVF